MQRKDQPSDSGASDGAQSSSGHVKSTRTKDFLSGHRSFVQEYSHNSVPEEQETSAMPTQYRTK